jgi:hypothetical protein
MLKLLETDRKNSEFQKILGKKIDKYLGIHDLFGTELAMTI